MSLFEGYLRERVVFKRLVVKSVNLFHYSIDLLKVSKFDSFCCQKWVALSLLS